MGLVYLLKGDVDQALPWLEKSIGVNPKSVDKRGRFLQPPSDSFEVWFLRRGVASAEAKGGPRVKPILNPILLPAFDRDIGIAARAAFGYYPLRNTRVVMMERPRIALAPDVRAGKPVIRGTRLSVEFAIGQMADGWSEADILQNDPDIAQDDMIACLAYARDTPSSETVFPCAA